MKLNTLKTILNDLRKTRHAGPMTSYSSPLPCDLEKIGSPGRPYRNCTCGLDDRIAEVEDEIKKLVGGKEGNA